METFNTNTTIRLIGTFTDWAAEGETGDLMDPDSVIVNIISAVKPNEYDNIVITAGAGRESLGVYYYDWVTPSNAGDFIVEFVGTKDSKPIVSRQKIQVRYIIV